MKKFWQIISTLLSVLVLGCALFGGGYLAGSCPEEPVILAEAKDRKQTDWKMPGELRKVTLTREEVSAEIRKLGELATYCGRYRVTATTRCARYLLEDVAIPGTTNTVTIHCAGMVKVGYDVESIAPTVDNGSKTIYIALPEPEVLDNYILWDSVTCEESNNIFNPLDFSRYQEMITDLERKGLRQVEKEGIYTAAEDQVKLLLQGFLSGFSEYEVVFL